MVRALDAENVEVGHLQLHSPSLDDVFLAKTGHKMRLGDAKTRPASARRCRRVRTLLGQIGEMARRSIAQTMRQPALFVPAGPVPAVPAGGQRRRARRGHEAPRLPDRLLPQLRDRDPVHAGRAVRRHQRGLEPRARRRDRLPQAARADADAARRAAARQARRRHGGRAGVRADLPRRRPGRGAGGRGGRRRRARAARAGAPDRARVRRAGRARRAAHRLRRGRAGPLPAVLRPALPVLDEPAARPDRAGLVPRRSRPGTRSPI